jgi:hypothetical protein
LRAASLPGSRLSTASAVHPPWRSRFSNAPSAVCIISVIVGKAMAVVGVAGQLLNRIAMISTATPAIATRESPLPEAACANAG